MLLEDANLKTCIDEYKKKSLAEREKDPLRMIFRWNRNAKNYNLNSIIKNKTIKLWFEDSMKKTPKENRQDIYFVLLELFGKDFEFGGEYDGEIPKAKLWDKVNEQEVRNWYKENKIQTDLFPDLKIEIEDSLNKNNFNFTNIINQNRSKRTRKEPKTSNLGYKIGLVLDILATALFIYLAIKIIWLFCLFLVITLPVGIFCAIKLCRSCLNSCDNKIKLPYENGNDSLSSEIHEFEDMPIQGEYVGYYKN